MITDLSLIRIQQMWVDHWMNVQEVIVDHVRYVCDGDKIRRVIGICVTHKVYEDAINQLIHVLNTSANKRNIGAFIRLHTSVIQTRTHFQLYAAPSMNKQGAIHLCILRLRQRLRLVYFRLKPI